jgi:hypothetical protein
LMPLEVVVPTSFSTAREPLPAARLSALSGLTIGFVHNSKPGARTLLDEVAAELTRRHRIESLAAAKTAGGIAVPDALVRQLSARCHAIVTGLGD